MAGVCAPQPRGKVLPRQTQEAQAREAIGQRLDVRRRFPTRKVREPKRCRARNDFPDEND